MDFRTTWLEMDRAQRLELAQQVGTSYAYLQKLSGGFGFPSMAFIVRLRKALPRLDLEGFFEAAKSAGKRDTWRSRATH